MPSSVWATATPTPETMTSVTTIATIPRAFVLSNVFMGVPFGDESSAPRGGLVGLEEGPRMLDHLADRVLGLLPRIDRRLGVGREAHDLHRHRVGMRRNVVRQHQDRGATAPHEIARHREDEVGGRAVHLGQEPLDHGHRDVGALRAERRAPVRGVVVPEEVGLLRPMATRLAHHRGHPAVGRALEQLPDERAPDAVTEHEELVDAEVVHEAELIVGVGVPGPIDLERAGRLPGERVAQVHGDAAEVVLELLHCVEGGSARPPADGRIEPAARDQQQRKPGADLFIVDAHGAAIVERHRPLLLGEWPLLCREARRSASLTTLEYCSWRRTDRGIRLRREGHMITATVRYKLPPHIDYAACRAHFHTIAPGFRGVKGLISKHFIWSASGWAGGVYQWETLEEAKAFYAGSWLDGIVERYGMRPEIEFYEVFALTDNARGTVEMFEEPVLRSATA